MTHDPFERAAERERSAAVARAGFRIHFAIYAAVQVVLFVIWHYYHSPHEVMPWFLFPLLGWGVGVVAHFVAVRAWIGAGTPGRIDDWTE